MHLINRNKVIVSVILLVVGIVSFSVLTKISTDPKNHEKTITALDDKKNVVFTLAAASTAAATALAAVPGDATTPVANELADLTSYFLIILAVVFLEKYLVTLTGYVTFRFLIPIACVLFIVGLGLEKSFLKTMAVKLAVFGVIIFAIIPTSMRMSAAIEKSYDFSFEKILTEAKNATDEINESHDDEEKNFFSETFSRLKGDVSGLVKKGEVLMNGFIEAIAVMIVTSCGIPLVVIMFSAWLAKIMFEIPVSLPAGLPKIKVGKGGH